MPVFLPLEKIDKCQSCGKGTSEDVGPLRICAACGERVYCSEACQTQDWKASHKNECGKTDRIDLATFYPFLACLAAFARYDHDVPVHFALLHQIVNAPNPGTPATMLPDRSWAKVIRLGREISQTEFENPNSYAWWPKAQSLKVLSKMRRRIVYEEKTLPIVMSLCIALAAEMYTSTSGSGSTETRTRLRYRSSPIADFGICQGSVDVKAQDRLAYVLPDGEVVEGQDPDKHYWIYFTTLHGEEVLLDIAMFTFNMCLVIVPSLYSPELRDMAVSAIPAYFRDREQQKSTRSLHTERRRYSFLRDTSIRALVGEPGFFRKKAVHDAFLQLLQKIDDTECAEDCCMSVDRTILRNAVIRNCLKLQELLLSKRWKQFPSEVPLAIEDDPGEYESIDVEKAKESVKKYKKMYRKAKKAGK